LAIPAQFVHSAGLEQAFRKELNALTTKQLITRLWNKDASLWPMAEFQADSIKGNLSWLDLPATIGPYMGRVGEFASGLRGQGIEDLVFVALGDSNLAAASILRFLTPGILKQFLVLDSIQPDTVRTIVSRINLNRTLFVFASKSGKRLETHALLLYFLDRLKRAGELSPGNRFVAVTEENSYLAEVAQEYKFSKVFYDPPGVSGRYSGLIHFSLLLAAFCRVELPAVLARVEAVRQACGPAMAGEANPAVALAALLAAGTKAGRDKLILFATESLTPLTERISQLVGVSSGKSGRGIIPIISGIKTEPEVFREGCLAVFFALRGDSDSEIHSASKSLQETGVPVVTSNLEGPEDLPSEIFKWELATALLCSQLGVNPFQEPDIRESRQRALEVVQRLEARQENPDPTVRVREGGIELFAEGATRQQISTLSLTEALCSFFDARNGKGYLALLSFVDQNSVIEKRLQQLRDELASQLRIPVQLNFGPRYLHQLEQLYLGGPENGLFLMLTAEPVHDLAIPGAKYTFGQLEHALAQGDFESLTRRDRLVVRLHLTAGAERGLVELEDFLQRALPRSRRSSR
jgi:transaldolase / glucose-6-phosphate isomerase